MASAVDICNTALAHIGEDSVISSISPPDRSVNAGHCARFYPLARRAALAGDYAHRFALTRATLAEVTNDSEEWDYKYALPSGCLRTRKVFLGSSVDYKERDEAEYQVEGSYLYTDVEDAVLLYTADQTDVNKFPADFVLALGLYLAGYLAGPIIKGREGARIGAAYLEQGMRMLAAAAASNANDGHETAEFTPASLAARR